MTDAVELGDWLHHVDSHHHGESEASEFGEDEVCDLSRFIASDGLVAEDLNTR
jgi:hypothetical protein